MENKKERKWLFCPICNRIDHLRANIMQDVDVKVSPEGDLESGYDSSLPELDESGALFCSNCGVHLWLREETPVSTIVNDE